MNTLTIEQKRDILLVTAESEYMAFWSLLMDYFWMYNPANGKVAECFLQPRGIDEGAYHKAFELHVVQKDAIELLSLTTCRVEYKRLIAEVQSRGNALSEALDAMTVAYMWPKYCANSDALHGMLDLGDMVCTKN